MTMRLFSLWLVCLWLLGLRLLYRLRLLLLRLNWNGAGLARLNVLHRALQRRLHRCIEQPAAIGGRIVDELPLVVVLLFIEFANAGVFAGTHHAHDRSSPKNLAGKLDLTCVLFRR